MWVAFLSCLGPRGLCLFLGGPGPNTKMGRPNLLYGPAFIRQTPEVGPRSEPFLVVRLPPSSSPSLLPLFTRKNAPPFVGGFRSSFGCRRRGAPTRWVRLRRGRAGTWTRKSLERRTSRLMWGRRRKMKKFLAATTARVIRRSMLIHGATP